MEKKSITKRFMKDYKYHLGIGNESFRFYNDKYFLKFFLKNEVDINERRKTVELLEMINHPYAVTPKFLLFDKNKFTGYAMDSYIDYKTLDKNNINSFNERKDILIELIRLINYFENNNFIYYDFHEKNILYKNNDIKLIDLDSGIFKEEINNLNYESTFKYANNKLAFFSLSFIYNINSTVFSLILSSDYFIINDLINKLPNNLKEFYEYTLSEKYIKYFDIEHYLDLIDENIYNDTKKIILKK